MTMKFVVPNIINTGLWERVGMGLTLSRYKLSNTGQKLPHLKDHKLANKINHNTTALYLPSGDNGNRNDI